MRDEDLRSSSNMQSGNMQEERSLGELLGHMTSDVGTLMRKELELAKVETREEMKRGAKVASMGGVAALGAWMAILFFSMAVAWWLDMAMNRGLAFLIVAVVWGIVAAVLISKAKAKAKEFQGLPETTQTLKEDVQWARTQTN